MSRADVSAEFQLHGGSNALAWRNRFLYSGRRELPPTCGTSPSRISLDQFSVCHSRSLRRMAARHPVKIQTAPLPKRAADRSAPAIRAESRMRAVRPVREPASSRARLVVSEIASPLHSPLDPSREPLSSPLLPSLPSLLCLNPRFYQRPLTTSPQSLSISSHASPPNE